MQDINGHSHPVGELCDEGKQLYATALRAGKIPRSDLTDAPCLIQLALLYPDSIDPDWFRPVPASAALSQLLRPIEREIQERRRLTVALADAFQPFMTIGTPAPSATGAVMILEGLPVINAALDRAIAECSVELLTLQPGSGRVPEVIKEGMRRVQPLLDKGVHMRTLYQHTARHHSATLGYVKHVAPFGVEVRTLEEIIDRLIIVDRKIAFVPAQADRQVALELRHPGLVAYLRGVFDQFWNYATPWEEQLPHQPQVRGLTAVQRSIAKLLVEGLVDEAIARRLGMNVRTCRGHIAKLSATLGSGSRTQLGYLIARSGILDKPDGTTDVTGKG
ncbi:helix-turn-helix transcriptional regulator [Streptomyces sp. NPDC060194]|uniref:helix-turn-helix transcriptional regulator n=1 Tax=Streptomyces sp. NPDC060194 TaxID=3347069 RepID=UPI00365CEE1F